MPYYAIYACESTYGGMHGINNIALVECENDDHACDLCHEYGLELFDEYDLYGEDEDNPCEPETDGKVYLLELPDEPNLVEIEQELNDDFEGTACFYNGILVN